MHDQAPVYLDLDLAASKVPRVERNDTLINDDTVQRYQKNDHDTNKKGQRSDKND